MEIFFLLAVNQAHGPDPSHAPFPPRVNKRALSQSELQNIQTISPSVGKYLSASGLKIRNII